MGGTSLKHFLATSLICCLLLGLLHLQKTEGGACYNGIAFRASWIPIEGEEDVSANGFPITLTGARTKTLVDAGGSLIAYVAEPTFSKCKEEGVCLVHGDQFLVSYVGGQNVFRVLDREVFPAGVGGWENALQPFVSVGTTDFAPGTLLYVEELDGKILEDTIHPTYHNGCVRVDDRGSGACTLEFFTGYYKNFKAASPRLPRQVYAEARSDCTLLDYTPLVLGLRE